MLKFTCKHAKAFVSWSEKNSTIWQQGWKYTSSMFYLPSIWLSPLSVEMAALSVSNRAFSKSFIFSSFKLNFTPWIFLRSCHESLSTLPVRKTSLLVSLTESLSLQHLLTTRTNNRLLVKRMVSGLSSTLGAKFFHKETDKGCPLARMHEEVFLQCLETQ